MGFGTNLRFTDILNKCRTGLGAQTMRRWMLRPLVSLSHLAERHQAVEVLVRPENREITKSIRDYMKAIKNIHYVFSQLNSGDMSAWMPWRNLADVSREFSEFGRSIAQLCFEATTGCYRHSRVDDQS